MQVKCEQNRMVQSARNFELFDKKTKPKKQTNKQTNKTKHHVQKAWESQNSLYKYT